MPNGGSLHQRCSTTFARCVNGESTGRNLCRSGASYCGLKLRFFPRAQWIAFAFIASLSALLPRAEAVFSAGFTADEIQSTGLTRLSAAERARLDELMARDVEFALEGGVAGFSRTFSARLRPADFQAAGLQHLNPAQLAALDDLAAFRIAHPVVEEPHFIAKSPPKSTSLAAGQIAKGAALSPSAVTSTGWHPEVHGDVHLEVGGGKGGSFYGGGLDVVMTDPDGKFTLALSYSQYHGKGWIGADALSNYGPWAFDPALAGLPLGWAAPGWIPGENPDDPDSLRNANLRSTWDPAR